MAGPLEIGKDRPSDTFTTDKVRAGNNNNADYPTVKCENNPDCEDETGVGPLPAGTYEIGRDRTLRGNTRITLAAQFKTSRNGFQIHRDFNVPARTVGTKFSPASEGCIAVKLDDYNKLRDFLDKWGRGRLVSQ